MKSFCLCFLISCFVYRPVFASEKAVLNQIFDGYDVRIRPVQNSSLPVVVKVQLILLRLIEVNAKQEYIKLALSVEQYWTDEFLRWDPEDYNGTDMVSVQTTSIWIPDTVITTTSAEPETMMNNDRQMVKIMHDGSLFMSLPFVLSNYCQMKTDEFPYDQQNCIIKVSSWIYSVTEISYELVPNLPPNIQNIQDQNSEWEILPYTASTHDFEIGGVHFRELFFTLTIKRKPAYYVWVLIIPTFVITALSIAGIFAPVNIIGDRQEKITLGLTTLLTLAVILSMVTDEMPRTIQLPLLGMFVLVEIVIIVLCMAISVVILFLHQRSTTRPWTVPHILQLLLFNVDKHRDNANSNFLFRRSPPPVRNINKRENNAKFSHTLKERKSTENVKSFDENTLKLNEAISNVIAFIEMRKQQETKAQEDEEHRKHQWLILFDHVDLIIFVVVQVVHAVLYVTFFRR